jgi:KaiC/GvpD/RAD55 family RecA-like ATPase
VANKKYTEEITHTTEEVFIRMMIQDPSLYVRVAPVFNPDNFNKELKECAKFIKEHVAKFQTVPSFDQVKAATGKELEELSRDIRDQDIEWFMDRFESFTRRQELERAILKSVEHLEKNNYGPVESLIKNAVQITLTRDLGTDFWSDPSGMLSKYFSGGSQTSTGWQQLDDLLFGGFSKGELQIFAGGSGSGKSLVMMNIALNWLEKGLNGIYFSLELSEELAGLRTVAMLTDMSTRDIRKNPTDAALKTKMLGRNRGKYQIKYFPAQSSVNDLRAFIKEYETQTNVKVDFVMVDYLDLVMPSGTKVNPAETFIKDKHVSEELRNLAKEMNVLMITASQLNRSAVDEVDYTHGHIAGGISKINTADSVFGILTSRSMKERGIYQIQCMKSRSSTGVGHKIDLQYNPETMRITDAGPSNDSTNSYSQPKISTPVQSQITQLNKFPTEDNNNKPQPTVRGDVKSQKLASLLNSVKSNRPF